MCRLWIPPYWCRYLGYMSYTTWVIAFLCWNLQFFVTMATWVSLSNFWLSPLNRPIPKTPYWMQVYGWYILRKASYCQFCVKIRDFSLPWQQGRSEEIRLTPSNVPTPNTPNLVQISGLYVLYNLSYCYFCAEICKFSLPWQQGVGLSNFWLSPLNRPTPKNPYWVQVCASHLLCKASYSQFCVKIRDFSSPWQQGRSGEIRLTPSNVPTPNTPKLVQISGLYVLYNLTYSYFCPKICKFSVP